MTDAPVRQQLAAILSADIVSYSRLMELDEKGTLERLKDMRATLFDPLVAEHGGRIFKTTGDGILCMFPAAAAAVECAVDIQAAIAAYEPDLPADRRLCLRIGVSLGDVLMDGDDVFGDGVNLAARLEALAEPGGVYISGTAHDTLRGDLGEAFEDEGAHSLKNIARPIHVWRWRAAAGGMGAGPGRAGHEPTLAILPFTAPAASPEAEGLAEGIADDLTSTLARRTGVDVLAGSLRASLRAAAGDLPALRRLGADYVLTGALRQSGARIRLTAELLETASGTQIWSDRYDRTLDDPFELQDELSAQIGMAVRTSMNAYEGRRLGDKPMSALSDAECRAKAAEHFYRFTAEDYALAESYLRTVLERSPRDAIALAMCGYCIGYGSLVQIHPLAPDRAAAALDMVERAVQLNKSSDYAYFARGVLAMILRGDIEAAIADARQALSISPNYPLAIALLGDGLCYASQVEEGIALLHKATDANVRDPANFMRHWMLSMALFGKADYTAALEEVDLALRVSHEMPNFFLARAAILQQLGRTDEARETIRDLKRQFPDATAANIHQPRYCDPALRARYLDALRAAGLDGGGPIDGARDGENGAAVDSP